MKTFELVARGACVGVIALQLCLPARADDPDSRPVLGSSTPAGTADAGRKCRPGYPPAALKAKATGITVVAITISASGEVTNAEVVQSAGPTPEHKLLDQVAASVLRDCPFRARTDAAGHVVSGVVQVTYRWVLD